MSVKKERQLNYELLRIVAMLMIVCLHYLGKGGLLGDPARADMNAAGYTAWMIEAFCLVSVNVYVLISGYFGVDSVSPRTDEDRITFREVLRRPRKIWYQVLFYALTIGCIPLLIGVQKFDLYQFFSYCFPIVTEHYWFATSYVVLCLLMPFLNSGVSHLKQKEIGYLLVGLLVIFSISKTVIPMQLPWDKDGYDVLWFVILYLTGAYLNRYELRLLKDRWRACVLYLGSAAVIFISFFLLRWIYLKTGRLEKMINYGYSYNFFACYTGAVGLFLAFRQKKASLRLERFRKPILLFSGASFGVYLIHEHINLRYEWLKWFHVENQIQNSVVGFLLHMLISVLCVYFVCTLLELIRQKIMTTQYLPALILLLYPLRHAVKGLDLMDAGYALGNYRFFDTLNQTWKLATYLANLTGVLLSKLPFGDCWIGMNLYCGLLIGAVAAWVYLFVYHHYGDKRKGVMYLLFIAEFAALSLCWAPPVILYHYLGYLLMTIASVLLFTAIIKNNNRYFMISGIILGLCVAVRMPNITYMALILPVWCDCFWKRQSHKQKTGKNSAWIQVLCRQTLRCIAGYLIGLIVPLIVICVRYGVAAYPEMIGSLFGMTENASDYKPTSMIMAMFGDYIQYSVWLILFAGYMAAGLLFFTLLNKLLRSGKTDKITIVFKTLYVFGFLIVLRFCYGRGMFDFDYGAYFSMYKWVTVYLLLVILLCIWCLLYKGIGEAFKLWAVFILVTIFITPLGSNNGLYPIVNNLFLTAPISILMSIEIFKQSRKHSGGFAFRMVWGGVLVCTALQSVFFGKGFIFHDSGVLGSQERLALSCSSAANGLITTADKKAELEELDRYLYQNAYNEKQVILYGNIPALAYLLDMKPAIFSTWVDLDSNDIDVLKSELDALTLEADAQTLPVVIFGRQSTECLTESDGLEYQKLELIKDFMEENGYTQSFQNASYIVYSS